MKSLDTPGRSALRTLLLAGLLLLSSLVVGRAFLSDAGADAAADAKAAAKARAALAASITRGKVLWRQSWRPGAKGCFACHVRGPNKMLGQRLATYPKFDLSMGKVVSARQKINHMIKVKSGGKLLALASDDLTALEAYIKTLR